VVMSNLYTDPDSVRNRRAQAQSLFTASSLAPFTDDPGPGLASVVLHEAAHNLGPSHEYKVRGKTDSQVFGGPLASTLEELKAQTAALWYTEYLTKKGVLTADYAQQVYASSLLWAMGHISRGMYDSSGKPKAYSHVAAIQIGHLLKQGALRFEPETMAANGQDQGAFVVEYAKIPAAVDSLMKAVAKIKAKGDKKAAEAMVKELVDGPLVPQSVITERMLRFPKASFVYAADF
jgi:hypothetical protein